MYPHPLPITETNMLSFSFENQTSWAHGVWLSVGNKELQLTVTQGCPLQCTPVPLSLLPPTYQASLTMVNCLAPGGI